MCTYKGRGQQKKVFDKIMAGHFPTSSKHDESIDPGSSRNTHTGNQKEVTPRPITVKH